MKKALVLAAVLLAGAPAALGAAVMRIQSQKDNVVITENTLYGDPAEAAGLRVRMAAQWEGHLIWDTVYTMGSGETESSFEFSALEKRWRESDSGEISIYCNTSWGTVRVNGASRGFAPEENPLSQVVKAVMERTAPGERRQETVRLRDYYQYYPLQFYLYKNQFDVYYYEPGQESTDYFSNFFRIPVNDNEVLEVTLEKDTEGAVVDVHCSSKSGVIPFSLAAFGRDGCYHAYYLEEYESGNSSVSISAETGENYGIYYYPYIKENQSGKELSIDPARARKVCDLKPGIALAEMALNEAEDRLYLVTKEEQDFYLNVYDVAGEGLDLRQRLLVRTVAGEMGEETSPFWRRLSVQKEGVLMIWADGSFAFAANPGGEMELWLLEQEAAPGPLFPYESVWDFDGERLALVSYAEWESVSVNLAVYRQEGLVYCGVCEHSGDLGKETGDTSLVIMPPGTTGGFTFPASMVGKVEPVQIVRRRIPVEEILGVEW